jgi:hypothetical protein
MEDNMKKIIVLFVCLFLFEVLHQSDTHAIPAFTRKYGFNCTICHTGFTKLNDFGQIFRDDGYQLQGQEEKEKKVFDLAPPLAAHLPLGYATYNNKNGTASSFNLFGFDLLASGTLQKNISFLLIFSPRVDEPAKYFNGRDSSNNSASRYGALEAVSLVFSNVIPGALNIRVGRFEPGYHLFSLKRSYYLFQPYEIYTMTSPSNIYKFNLNQIGIEATGHFPKGFKYSAGIVNGNGPNPDNNNQKDIYTSLSQSIGNGDGESAGHRLGMFTYYGWQPLSLPGSVVGNAGQTNGKVNKAIYRVGFNGSFNLKDLNILALYFFANDNKAFNTYRPSENYRYHGGFLECDYSGFRKDRKSVV